MHIARLAGYFSIFAFITILYFSHLTHFTIIATLPQKWHFCSNLDFLTILTMGHSVRLPTWASLATSARPWKYLWFPRQRCYWSITDSLSHPSWNGTTLCWSSSIDSHLNVHRQVRLRDADNTTWRHRRPPVMWNLTVCLEATVKVELASAMV